MEFDPSGKLNRRSLRAARKYLATLGLVKWALIQHLYEHSPELCGQSKPVPEAKP